MRRLQNLLRLLLLKSPNIAPRTARLSAQRRRRSVPIRSLKRNRRRPPVHLDRLLLHSSSERAILGVSQEVLDKPSAFCYTGSSLAKKRMGRPPVPTEKALSKLVVFRLTQSEYRRLRQTAKQRRASVTDLVREGVLAVLKGAKQ